MSISTWFAYFETFSVAAPLDRRSRSRYTGLVEQSPEGSRSRPRGSNTTRTISQSGESLHVDRFTLVVDSRLRLGLFCVALLREHYSVRVRTPSSRHVATIQWNDRREEYCTEPAVGDVYLPQMPIGLLRRPLDCILQFALFLFHDFSLVLANRVAASSPSLTPAMDVYKSLTRKTAISLEWTFMEKAAIELRRSPEGSAFLDGLVYYTPMFIDDHANYPLFEHLIVFLYLRYAL